jgi:hypothetical protein
MISTDEGISIRRTDLSDEILFSCPLESSSVTCDCDPEREPPERDRVRRISEGELIESLVSIKSDRLKYHLLSSSHFTIDRIADKSLSKNRFAQDSKQNVISAVPRSGQIPQTFKQIEASLNSCLPPRKEKSKNADRFTSHSYRNIHLRGRIRAIDFRNLDCFFRNFSLFRSFLWSICLHRNM